tara:strand:- start:1 stop:327 length:327 start_codon:yes stop_codon:yes gene_type:complete
MNCLQYTNQSLKDAKAQIKLTKLYIKHFGKKEEAQEIIRDLQCNIQMTERLKRNLLKNIREKGHECLDEKENKLLDEVTELSRQSTQKIAKLTGQTELLKRINKLRQK